MKKIFKPLLLLIIILGIIWVGGLFWFKSYIVEEQKVVSAKTDAIVILTGGTERLEEGLRLLRENYSENLFISGVGKKATIRELLIENGFTDEVVEEVKKKVELGYEAENTLGNARETAKWMQENDYHSLRMVTSNYHMTRSMLEFRIAMPDVVIIPHAVTPENVKLDQWWKYPGTRNLIITEYNKFLGATLHYFLND